MSRHALTLNVVLGAIAIGFATYIAWEVLRPAPSGGPQARSKSGTPPPVAAIPARPAPEPAGSWSVITSRNPFSPSRSEAPLTGALGGPALNVPKPNLYGIVLKDGAPFAYIEDPVTKRVAAYRIGDAVAGGTVQKIARDGIMLARPEGVIDVRLHDPGKPRPAAPTPAAAASPSPATPPLPGVVPPVAAGPQTQAPAEAVPPPQPSTVTPGVESATPPRPTVRRPLPPNLLRRLPQPPPSDDQSR
ncbi:MAG TPA: hypothetical protein VLG10_01575 [Methylomirabilota bacterium]|nr:hypothetical protein [Methylomirabilota bacterium]